MDPNCSKTNVHHLADIELLRRQVLQVVDFRNLSVPSGRLLVDAAKQRALHELVFADGAQEGTESYYFKVLKKIISAISDACTDPDEDGISDDLASCLGSLLETGLVGQGPVGSASPEPKHISYTPPQTLTRPASNLIRVKEAANCYSGAGTTGHRTWEAALHLAYHLCGPEAPVRAGMRVLELGSGRGLVSHVCADVCRVARIVPTDGAPQLIQDLERNKPERSEAWSPWLLDWELDSGPGSYNDLPHDFRENLDIVLGADITYDSRVLPSLVMTIAKLLTDSLGSHALVAATVRNKKTLLEFEKLCSDRNLLSEQVAVDCPDAISDQTGFFHSHATPIRVYRLRCQTQPK